MEIVESKEQVRLRRAIAVSTLAVAFIAAGCAPTDRTGGDLPPEAVVLELASPTDGTPAQLGAYIDLVEELSDGSIHITVTSNWASHSGPGNAEQATLDDVAAGEVDMAWVGTRAFDDLGRNAFPALHAPLLVDSYNLQRAVFDAGIPQKMLADVNLDGLHPLAVLPGPLRKIVGVEHAFVSPADFVGATLPYENWETGDAVMRALGVAPGVGGIAQQPLSGLDGISAQLGALTGNDYQNVASHLSANLNMYPRALAVVAGADVFGSLDPRQQQALEQAAELAIGPALDYSIGEDMESSRIICGSPMQVDTLTESQLSDFKLALQDVLGSIAGDPIAAEAFAEISALKATLASPPEGVVCAGEAVRSAPSTEAGSSELDGSAWTTTITLDELAAADLYDHGELHEGNTGPLTLEFGSDGTLIFTHREGPEDFAFEVTGDQIAMDREDGELWGCRWSVLEDTLTLTRDDAVGPCPTMLRVKPWTRIQ